jgi:hypothetical protein
MNKELYLTCKKKILVYLEGLLYSSISLPKTKEDFMPMTLTNSTPIKLYFKLLKI